MDPFRLHNACYLPRVSIAEPWSGRLSFWVRFCSRPSVAEEGRKPVARVAQHSEVRGNDSVIEIHMRCCRLAVRP